ncbi:MAG: radical SAM/SPASM domain-containing protein [Promethearchaeota archaeon]|nr:MAG: radical SAM/SPASM domain-containing protein [Candidatus Lokiarchaeota archaeon]
MGLDVKKILKRDFFEFKLRPFILKYFTFLINFHIQFLNSFILDFKTLIYYYILKKRKEPSLSIPKTITVVLTNICNAKCVFCAYQYLKLKKETMSVETFKKFIDEYKSLGGEGINLSPTIGEDLVNKDFFEMIKYAKNQGFFVSINSNGILLNKNKTFKKIIDLNIDSITISTGDFIPEIEAEIFNIPQDLAKQKLLGLINLIKYKKERNSNSKIIIAFRAKRPFRKIWNTMNRTILREYFDERLFHIAFMTVYDNWCGNVTKENLLGIMKMKKRNMKRKYPCFSLEKISILPNGNVRLCACRIKVDENDDLVIGNILENSLLEILHGDYRRKIINDWQNGKIVDVCKDCARYLF